MQDPKTRCGMINEFAKQTQLATVNVDIAIPIFVETAKTNWLSYFLVQVKNRQADWFNSSITEAVFSLTKTTNDLTEKDPAHLSMMMCLRAKHDKKDGEQNPRIVHPPKSKRDPRSSTSSPQYKWDKQQRLVILAVGVSKTLYPIVDGVGNATDREAWLIVERAV